MDKLLVGSVYAPSERNDHWLDLQSKFLKKTTVNYDHVLFLNTVHFHPKEVAIIGQQKNNTQKFAGARHAEGLNVIIDYARNNNYKKLLLLDSDCFPILEGWQEKLEDMMIDFNFAAPIRTENLDHFAHPCAFYAKDISMLMFEYKQNKNFLFKEIQDCQSNVEKVYPLMRSNFVNFHPLMFGIYKGMFYHHCAGSRKGCYNKSFRSSEYHPHIEDLNKIENYVFDQLLKEPESVINLLTTPSLPIGYSHACDK